MNIPTGNSSNSDDLQCTAPGIQEKEAGKAAPFDHLPQKSKQNYEIAYNSFVEWQEANNTNSFSEDTLMIYFEDLSKKYKSSTLSTTYSMLKRNIFIRHNINIQAYERLRSLLRRESKGYRPKKSESFTDEEVNRFLMEAPDHEYLVTKVALIMGVTGACRSIELREMNIDHIRHFGGCIEVFIPKTEKKTPRKFYITDKYCSIVKKYVDLRPPNAPTKSFFLNYQKGKCTNQVIGVNKFGSMGKYIAKFLKLENPDNYTGHSLRRSCATLCAENDASMTTPSKQHGEQKSPTITETRQIEMESAEITSEQINYPIEYVAVKQEPSEEFLTPMREPSNSDEDTSLIHNIISSSVTTENDYRHEEDEMAASATFEEFPTPKQELSNSDVCSMSSPLHTNISSSVTTKNYCPEEGPFEEFLNPKQEPSSSDERSASSPIHTPFSSPASPSRWPFPCSSTLSSKSPRYLQRKRKLMDEKSKYEAYMINKKLNNMSQHLNHLTKVEENNRVFCDYLLSELDDMSPTNRERLKVSILKFLVNFKYACSSQ